MTVINSRVPSCIARGRRLPALHITFAQFDMPRVKSFLSMSDILRQEVVFLESLLEHMKMVYTGSRTTRQRTVTVQIGSKH